MAASVPTIRILVIAAALLVWANVTAFTVHTKTISLPLQVINLEAGLAVAEALPVIKVNISGSVVSLAKVSESNLMFAVDLNSIAANQTQQIPVTLQKAPKNISVLSYEPHDLTLSAEQAVTKQLPVTIAPEGNLADGYTISSATTNPGEVTLTGSPTLLDDITEVVAAVDVARRRSTFTIPAIPLVSLGENLSSTNIRMSPNLVEATINIEKGSPVRNLGVKPTFTGNLPAGFFLKEVRFDPPVVSVTGNQRLISGLSHLVSTPINLTDRNRTFSEQASIDLSTGVKVVGENLVTAEVIIERSEASREFSVSPEFINVTEGFGVTSITPRSIQLVVVGEQDVLANLKRTDIKLSVDLQRSLSGSNTITITPGMFSLPSGVGVGSFTPETIEVILSRL